MAKGKNVTWDVTVTDTIADSYLYLSVTGPDCAAEGAASGNEVKYAALEHSYTFIPIAIETYGPINAKGKISSRAQAAVSELLVTIPARQRFSFNASRSHCSVSTLLLSLSHLLALLSLS